MSDAFQDLSRIQHIDFYNNPKLLVLNGAHSPLSAALYYLPSKQFTSMGLANNELLGVPMVTNYVVRNTIERLNLSGNFLLNLGSLNIKLIGRHLRYLILKRSNIKTIADGVFSYLDKLEYINLAENQLRYVPEAVKLPLIKHLDLSFQCYTWICDFTSFSFRLNETSFDGMDSLSNLAIRGVLGRINKNSFVSAPHLEELDVSSIFLTNIDKEAFVNNNKLRKLTCSQCWLLLPLHVDLFSSLPGLEYLDLSYSPHSIIRDNSTAGTKTTNVLQNLRVLNLTCSLVSDHTMCDNALYQYESPLDPDLLTPITMLETLDMGKNGLTSWTERRFVNNPQLRRLSIQFNKFKSLTKAMLEDFRQLSYLDIRMNEGDMVLCDMQVVEFYYWANETEAGGNLTIEGWNDGHSYFCDDDKYHQIRSFREFGEHHDISPVPGSQVPVDSLFSQGIIVGLSTMGCILAIFIVLTYRKRFFISFWLMRQRKKYKYREKKDSNFLFDVFISYSQVDHEWVTKTLLPELEQEEPRLKVCIHERDFRVIRYLLNIFLSNHELFRLVSLLRRTL